MNQIKAKAQSDVQRIVLPEGEDPRTLEAAKQILAEKIAELVILGDPTSISVEGATVIDPKSAKDKEDFAKSLYELRREKGLTYEEAVKLVEQPTYYATMMVKLGLVDGLVSGACHSTADTLRPALQILKTAPGTKLVSCFMMLSVPNSDFGQNGTLLFSDIGLNEYPNSDQLSEIALSSAKSWESFMGSEARVAFLSYSTKGSAKGEWVEKPREAARLAREKNPNLACDGELQLDSALVDTVAKLKAPDSEIAGTANVLIFPNLDAGNIGYKLTQRLAGAEAIGPLMQGIAKPVNDLSRGCSAEDIVGVVAITCVQSQMAKAKEKLA